MENQNCSKILEDILTKIMENKKKLSGGKLSEADKQQLIERYQEIWLDFVFQNGFESKTINYLSKGKTEFKINLLCRYINESSITPEQCRNVLNTLYKSKIQKDILLDLGLGFFVECLHSGDEKSAYLTSIVDYLPYYYQNASKKGITSVQNMLADLHLDVDWSLIDLHVKNVALKNSFYDLINKWLNEINRDKLDEQASKNYEKLKEYIDFHSKDKQTTKNVMLQKKEIISEVKDSFWEKDKVKNLKKRITAHEISEFTEDWGMLKELISNVDDTFIACMDTSVDRLIEEIRILNFEKKELEKKHKNVLEKVNSESMAKDYSNKALNDEREYSARLSKQLKEEQESRIFYVNENSKLKNQIELNQQDIMVRNKRIEELEKYIKVIKLEASNDLQGSLNSIGGKLKREYMKFSEYLEVKASGKDANDEEDIKYLEYLLSKIFSVLEKNGLNIK